MFDAREFLRKKLIGKKVNVVVDYIQTARDNFPEKVCCTVTIGGAWVLFLSLMLIELFICRLVVRSFIISCCFSISCCFACLFFTTSPLHVCFRDSCQIISAAMKISGHETLLYCPLHGLGSSVGIATDYGLDGPGIKSRWGEIFRLSRPALGPTQPPVQWAPGLSRG